MTSNGSASRDESTGTQLRERSAAWDVVYAALALVAVVIASSAVSDLLSSQPAALPEFVRLLASYAVVWIPLAAAVVFAGTGVGRRAVFRHLGLRVRPIDALWGVGIGLIARVIDAIVNLGATGATGLEPLPLIDGGPTGATLVLSVVAPVLIAPIVEEIFFRGLLQRSLGRVFHLRAGLSATASGVVSVVLTAAVFALMHGLVGPQSTTTLVLTLIGTFVFGLLAGAVTAATGRLGGAIIAHVVFNGLAVWATWGA
ncbi:lysostaphin resistance A-like protein [Frigoribacterium sp. 2-23]|uniref:CPBP family intramembrane glutamic endopeptidase n=1 Tax=Frigoribacterium sp. 2-23 TaxID=3415006 RepID=UPI003C6FF763